MLIHIRRMKYCTGHHLHCSRYNADANLNNIMYGLLSILNWVQQILCHTIFNFWNRYKHFDLVNRHSYYEYELARNLATCSKNRNINLRFFI